MMASVDLPLTTDVVLRPGEFYFGGGRTRVHTLLGSCVAITLWHPARRIGGMCHYLLATRGLNQRLSEGHYADEAVQMFLHEVKRARTEPCEYEVKMFGGGNMFRASSPHATALNVSQSNIHSGALLLRRNGFCIKATDVGGSHHRKIYLELWNGDVWVQRGGSVFRERD